MKKREAHLARHKGVIYAVKHDVKKSMEYFKKSLALAEEIEDKEGMFTIFFNIANNYMVMGDLQLALNSAQKAKALGEEIGDIYLIAVSLIMLGGVYLREGNLNKAENILTRALELNKEYDLKFFVSLASTSLGRLNWELGNLEHALKYFEYSNSLLKKIGAHYGIASIDNLFYLICLTIEMDFLEQAQKYLQQLQEINEQKENTYSSPFYDITKAMFLKKSSRIRDKAKAQDILLKLVDEENLDIKVKIIVRLNLCELLLDELKSYEDEAIFKETLEIANQVYSLAEKSRSFSLVIKLLLLQARFASVKGDLTESLNFIEQAKSVAEDKGLESLAERADIEKKQLETQFEKWQQLIKNNARFGVKIQQSRLEDYMKEVKRIIK